MRMPKRLLALSLAAVTLTGCETVQPVDAAADVHHFLIAIRDNDKTSFNRYVDKPALSRELEAKLGVIARAGTDDQRGQFVGAFLAGPIARAAADAAVRPDVFRAIAVSLGYSPDRPIPGQFAIAQALRPVADGQVCAAKGRDKPCLLTFSLEEGSWRLTGVAMDQLRL
jgi:hypothetical protein